MNDDQKAAVLQELLDVESVRHWGSFAGNVALWYLGEGSDEANQLVRIASARAAKAKGIPLWQWAQDYIA